jgi:hypothetical protein
MTVAMWLFQLNFSARGFLFVDVLENAVSLDIPHFHKKMLKNTDEPFFMFFFS